MVDLEIVLDLLHHDFTKLCCHPSSLYLDKLEECGMDMLWLVQAEYLFLFYYLFITIFLE